MAPLILSVSLPEYTVEEQPDYLSIGRQVDALLAAALEDGPYLVRALSLAEHPGKSLDDFAALVLRHGTDKYDPERQEEEKAFAGYDHEFHLSPIEVRGGRVIDQEWEAGDEQLAEKLGVAVEECVGYFAGISYRFRDFILLARGVSLRVDLLTVYRPDLMAPAVRVDDTLGKDVGPLADYLFKFKDPGRKTEALAAAVKIGA